MHEDQRSLVGSEFIRLCLGKTFDYEGLVRAAACARGVSVVVTDGHVALPACDVLAMCGAEPKPPSDGSFQVLSLVLVLVLVLLLWCWRC